MNKVIFTTILLFLFVFFTSNPSAALPPGHPSIETPNENESTNIIPIIPPGQKVDLLVLKKLEKSNETYVLITLKNDSFKNLKEKKVKIKDKQGTVLSALTRDDFKLEIQYTTIYFLVGNITLSGIKKLEENPHVEVITDASGMGEGTLAESVPLVHGPDVWNLGYNGTGQTICVVDSGVNYTNPELGGCFGTGCKVIAGYDYVNSDGNPMDDNSHGTWVTGMLISSNETLKGLAPGVKIAAVKVLGSDKTGLWTWIANGVEWCNNNRVTYDISVISMSIGSFDRAYNDPNCIDTSGSAAVASAIDTAVANGLFVSVSSGNYGKTNGIGFPACRGNAVSVGATYDADVGNYTSTKAGCTDATTAADKMACFTNRDEILDLVAPGVLIKAQWLNCRYCHADKEGQYLNSAGTSASAPHVSGAAAILRQIKSGLSPSDIRNILKDTGVDVYDSPTGLTFPRLDVLNATIYVLPPIQSEWDPAKGSTITTNSQTITFDTNENAWCKWSLFDQDYDSMTDDCTGDGTTSQSCATSGLSEGSEWVYIACKDVHNNNDTASTNEDINYNVDTAPPTGTIAINDGAAYTTSTSVTLTLSCSDASGCSQMQFSNDGTSYSTPEAYTTTKSWTLTTGDGTKTVYVKYKDGAGNWMTTPATDTIVLDTTPPTTTDDAPTGWQNTDATVTLTATDTGGSGVADTLYCVDQANTCSPATSGTTVLVSTEGTNYVRYYSTDNAGNDEAVNFATVQIDKTSPAITPSSPPDNSWTNDNTPAFQFTATDNLDASMSCELFVDGAGYGSASASNNTLTTITANASLSDGARSWWVNCTDDGPNTGQSAAWTLNIDTTLPQITLESPANTTYATTSVGLNVSASENIDTWMYNLNSGGNTTFTPNTTITGGEGLNNIVVYANDSVGNMNSSSVYFSVDTTSEGGYLQADIYATMFDRNLDRGNTMSSRVYVENMGQAAIDDFLQIAIADPYGEKVYKDLKPMYIEPGDMETFKISWTVPGDAPEGLYKLRIEFDDWDIDALPAVRWFDVGTASLDTTPPQITIDSPANTTYATTSINLDVSADEAIDTWMYSLNSAGNVTFTPNTTITGEEGLNTITVYANDTVGNTNSSTVWFTVSIPPTINMTSPPNETITDTTPDLNLTTDELVDIVYSWNSEGNISGCKLCTSYNTTYGENNGSDANLTALWHFNENSGTTLFDETANDNDGAITGATYQSGKFGYGLKFDGNGDFVNIPYDSALDVLDNDEPFTFAAWFKLDALPGAGIAGIYGQNGGTDTGRNWLFVSSTNDRIYTGLAGGGKDTGITAVTDTWYFAVIRYNGTGLQVYIDDVLKIDVAAAADEGADGAYYIGSNNAGSGGWFNGTIDEIMLFDRNLSAAEIQTLYNKTLPVGQHSVSVYAVDNASNSNSETKWFTVDTTPPVIIIDSPANETINDTTPDLNLTISETANVIYSWDGEGNISGCRLCTYYNTTYGEAVPEANTSLLLHFNEYNGPTAYDDSPHENDGTITDATWTAGKFGSALYFDGNSSFVKVPNTASLNVTEITVGAWVNPDYTSYPADTEAFIARKKSYSFGTYKDTGNFAIWLYNGSYYKHDSLIPMPLKNWSHVVFTYKYPSVTLYLNGEEVYSGEQTDVNFTTVYSTEVSSCMSKCHFWKGTIDDAHIMRRALNASEIADVYNRTFSAGQHSVSVWAMDDAGNGNSTTRWFDVG